MCQLVTCILPGRRVSKAPEPRGSTCLSVFASTEGFPLACSSHPHPTPTPGTMFHGIDHDHPTKKALAHFINQKLKHCEPAGVEAIQGHSQVCQAHVLSVPDPSPFTWRCWKMAK